MPDHEPRFSVGEKVRLKAQTSKVSGVLWEPEWRDCVHVYPVNFGTGPEYHAEPDLEGCTASPEPRDSLRNGN